AAVIGSAVYMGSWQPDALRLVERHREGLAGIPVWLFSSGPLGPDDPRFHPRQVPDLMQATHARDHRIFPGRLEARTLSLGERLAVRAVRAPEGDLRDWAAIRGWAREIAATLGVP
ncbi:MAG: flavodoxin domain-containing protein, partial [Bacillota bacterium]|nr:flavodoxin domain-containing protein [Bacillota bacterium]